MSSNDDIAYLVPKSTWERQREMLESAKQQSGGAVGGINADGSVDANALLRSMAVNMSLSQNPRAEFVKEADMMIKKILSNPKLTHAEKVDYLAAYCRSYADQRQAALAAPTSTAQETPATTPAAPQPQQPPPPPLAATPPQPVRASPPPPYMTDQASTSGITPLKKAMKRFAPSPASAKKNSTDDTVSEKESDKDSVGSVGEEQHTAGNKATVQSNPESRIATASRTLTHQVQIEAAFTSTVIRRVAPIDSHHAKTTAPRR